MGRQVNRSQIAETASGTKKDCCNTNPLPGAADKTQCHKAMSKS
jgi:hypothetical protein